MLSARRAMEDKLGKELAIKTRVPSIPSLPRRLVDLAWSLGTVHHEGQPVRYTTAAPLNAEARKEVEGLVENLTLRLDPMASFDPGDGAPPMDARSAKAMLLTKMILGLAGASKPDDAVVAAKMDMYADAIEGRPAWALDLAIKMWAGGECPRDIEPSPDFRWPPSPATLRRLIDFHLDLPKRMVLKFKNLLAAVTTARAMAPAPLPNAPAPGLALPTMRRM